MPPTTASSIASKSPRLRSLRAELRGRHGDVAHRVDHQHRALLRDPVHRVGLAASVQRERIDTSMSIEPSSSIPVPTT